jgi:hypothetical protein
MTRPDAERALGRELYAARLQAAWGQHWTVKDRWPVDDEAWRAYAHFPIAEVDLVLVQARAALKWFAEQA